MSHTACETDVGVTQDEGADQTEGKKDECVGRKTKVVGSVVDTASIEALRSS